MRVLFVIARLLKCISIVDADLPFFIGFVTEINLGREIGKSRITINICSARGFLWGEYVWERQVCSS